MNETLLNQIHGLIRAAAPVVVTVIVLNGWLPEALAGPFVDSALVVIATVAAMISSWRSNRPKEVTHEAPLVPPV
jgi:hypothetical protein